MFMTKERLCSLTLEELRELASEYRIHLNGESDRLSLVTLLFDYFEDMREEREVSNNPQVKGEEKKYEVSRDEEIGLSNEYSVPDGYNETTLTAVVRDPSWAYAYWDIDESTLQELKSSKHYRLCLRIHDVQGIDFDGANSNSHFDIPLKKRDRARYLNLPKPGSSYVLELLSRNSRKVRVLARSNPIHPPRGGFAEPQEGEAPADETILLISTPSAQRVTPSSPDSIPHRVSND
jgi:hypothetical protein